MLDSHVKNLQGPGPQLATDANRVDWRGTMRCTEKSTYTKPHLGLIPLITLKRPSLLIYRVWSFVNTDFVRYNFNVNLDLFSTSITALVDTMKLTIYLTSVLAGTVLAFPGMKNLMRELAKRQATGTPEMIGDLIQGATSPVGNQVKNCLLGTGSCQDLTPKVQSAL